MLPLPMPYSSVQPIYLFCLLYNRQVEKTKQQKQFEIHCLTRQKLLKHLEKARFDLTCVCFVHVQPLPDLILPQISFPLFGKIS